MLPIRKLLNRIKWDTEYGAASFEIAYLDRVAGGTIRVPFSDVLIEPGVRNFFGVMGPDGVWRQIPFHRVRRVYRNEVLVWKRPEPGRP